ncbi:hypothetical protein SAMN04515618_10874 [Collimonas sp. OK307]|uniref:hypothetical protein n=1 Tax=Collimonas sp. OK307 TaxID=1801620 RepID=UPI0008E2DB73|nr:hypothetical protein [Collimonas sp. OK307]SFI02780.1 hypothetical protein SAMN04515618_10874 [Collimonas sp. OK307]
MITEKFKVLNSSISLSAIHQRMVVYALNETEELTHVDAVSRGKACKCRCLSCGESLIARQGELKSHSFAHESGTECLYAVETMLQWLAKELISAHGYFVTPELVIYESIPGPVQWIENQKILPSKKVNIDSVQLEKRSHHTRPDLVLRTGGRELLLEISVTKKTEAKRLASFEKRQLSAIEIDLSKNRLDTVADFEKILFTDSEYKCWLFNAKEAAIRNNLQTKNLEQLSLQKGEYEQKRVEKEKFDATRNRQQSEAATQSNADKHAYVSKMLAVILSERPGLIVEQNSKRVYFRMKDGALWLLYGLRDSLYIVAQNGNEKGIRVLHEIGINYDAENLCYLALQSQYSVIMQQLRRFTKGA